MFCTTVITGDESCSIWTVVAKHSNSKDEKETRVDDDNEWYSGLSEWEIHLEGEIKKRERGGIFLSSSLCKVAENPSLSSLSSSSLSLSSLWSPHSLLPSPSLSTFHPLWCLTHNEDMPHLPAPFPFYRSHNFWVSETHSRCWIVYILHIFFQYQGLGLLGNVIFPRNGISCTCGFPTDTSIESSRCWISLRNCEWDPSL